MKYQSIIIFSGIIITGFISCKNPDTQSQQTSSRPSQAEMKETLIDESRKRMRQEVNRIDQYIERHNLNMLSTETGVRYRILEQGNGPLPGLLAHVSIGYTMSLLDGTFCYSSDSSGTMNFILGQSEEPSGLQEILLKIPEGSKAQVIVPSYMAYGLTGDGDCVGGDQSLVYNIQLLKVKPN
jgi:FKBP-type peptidyl-prolyl cis-trans isomerase